MVVAVVVGVRVCEHADKELYPSVWRRWWWEQARSYLLASGGGSGGQGAISWLVVVVVVVGVRKGRTRFRHLYTPTF